MSEATNDSERYYYADGERIALVTSREFVAVRPQAEGARAQAEAAIMSGSADPMQPPGQVFDLADHNLLVVRVPTTPITENGPGGQSGRSLATEALQAMVTAQTDLSPGPPVYEAANGEPTATEALIPIGEVIVKFKPGVSEDAARRLLEKHKLETRRTDYPEPGALLLSTQAGRDAIDAANNLHQSDLVEYAQPNFARVVARLSASEEGSVGLLDRDTEANGLEVQVLEGPAGSAEAEPQGLGAGPAAPPSDPAFASQWGLRKIMAPEAFDITMGAPSISVAVIDEGCDLTHEDMAFKLPGFDAYSGDDNPTPNGNDAHGTACAGIATAVSNNGRGGSGVAPRCRTMPVRIAQGIGGGFWSTTDAIVASGIRTAVDRGADVLSNSYSVNPSTAVTNAFLHARSSGRGGKGCPIAAATGNDNVRGVIYPARLSPTIPGFLAVGASNEWDQRKSKTSLDGETWWGSNWGPEVDVVAPGVHIYTPDIMGPAGYSGGNYVPNFNGTSSATPHVAGLMALILSVDPDLRSWEVEDIIKLTANDLGPAGRDEEFGFGRINARRAVEAASRIWYQISVVPEFIGAGRECFMRMSIRMYNPGINSVRLDSLTVTSHNPTWTSEIDRFEYRPAPGGVMAPRSGNDVRLNRLLLRANGNATSWSYRWALNWTYTFWRPGAPSFPASAGAAPLAEGSGRSAKADPVRGSQDGPRAVKQPEAARYEADPTGSRPTNGSLPSAGDTITVDRQTKAITIVVR